MKVTVELCDQAAEALEAVSYAEALSSTDIVNRALIAYSIIAATPVGSRSRINNHDGTRYVTVHVEERS